MVERINAAMRTIHTTTGLRPAPHVAARITRFARHDPAAVRGIASVLSREQVLGDAVLPDPLPAPRAIRKAVEGIVADLDPASLRLLTVAAHMVSDRTDVLLAAAAVDIAVVLSDRSTGALAFFDGRFRFRDDRLRAVLLQEEDAAHRKEVHRSLSRASALLPEPRIASWHALQSEAPNAPSPAALLPLAERLLRSGDLHGAFTVAAEVAGRSSDHARAEAALIAGRAAFALGCLDDATRLLSPAASHGSWAKTLLDDVARIRDLAHGRETDPADPSAPARAIAAAAAGIADARAMDALTRAAVVGEGNPEEADALQAGVLLSAIHARAEGPWRLSAGPLSPLIEAYARARHIAAQERDGDYDTAARSLRDAVGRLPMTLVAPRLSAQVSSLLVRGRSMGRSSRTP